jgi:hypothetical protein
MYSTTEMPILPKIKAAILFLFIIVLSAGMLPGFPLMGVYLTGYPLDRYLEFPPQTQYMEVIYPLVWNAWQSAVCLKNYVYRKQLRGLFKWF